jgi:hypothetical protein
MVEHARRLDIVRAVTVFHPFSLVMEKAASIIISLVNTALLARKSLRV